MYSVDYGTSVARISALSDRLLTLSQVERMLSADGAEESFRILNDLSWAKTLSEASGVNEFERVIDSGLYDLKSTIVKSAPSHDFLHFLLLSFDLQNAKSSLLAFIHEKQYEEVRNNLSSLSFYPRRTAFDILTGENVLDGSGKFFTDAILKAKKVLTDNPENINLAETLLDADFYRQMHKAVSSLKNPLLSEFFQKSVDVENIKKIIRRQSEKEIAYLTPKNSIKSFITISPEEGKGLLELSSVRSFLIEAENIIAEGEGLSNWELRTDLRLLDSLYWPSRGNPLQEENLVLFFLTKLRNAEVIRSILVGKKNNFSVEEIREMISPFLPFLPSS